MDVMDFVELDTKTIFYIRSAKLICLKLSKLKNVFCYYIDKIKFLFYLKENYNVMTFFTAFPGVLKFNKFLLNFLDFYFKLTAKSHTVLLLNKPFYFKVHILTF